MPETETAEKAVRDIRCRTRRRFSAEEKIRIVIEGLRGEESIASLCRRDLTPSTRPTASPLFSPPPISAFAAAGNAVDGGAERIAGCYWRV